MFVIEHPGPRHTTTVPCIWTLQVFKHLRRFPGLCEVDVYQGHYGAISPKPTRLAVSSVDRAKAILDSFRTVAELPPALDMRRVQGQGYTTAQLKEYPPDFSRGLAALALEWLRTDKLSHTGGPVPVTFPSVSCGLDRSLFSWRRHTRPTRVDLIRCHPRVVLTLLR